MVMYFEAFYGNTQFWICLSFYNNDLYIIPHTHNITPIAPILSSINFCIAITIAPKHFFLLCNFCNLEIEISMMLVWLNIFDLIFTIYSRVDIYDCFHAIFTGLSMPHLSPFCAWLLPRNLILGFWSSRIICSSGGSIVEKTCLPRYFAGVWTLPSLHFRTPPSRILNFGTQQLLNQKEPCFW